MTRGYLSEYFTGVGTKVLTPVDTPKDSASNQHEVGDGQNGRVLKRILGDDPRKRPNPFPARYIWVREEQESIRASGTLSWYDTRENQPHRGPEWRLYYQNNGVTEQMNAGDRLFVARQPDDTILFIVVPADSTTANQLLWLFGIRDAPFDLFTAQEIADTADVRIDFVVRLILDEIGIEYEDPHANELDAIIEPFGYEFPPTRVFSDHARLTLSGVSAREDPDAALVAWVDHEYAMFRRLEARIVEKSIRRGWTTDDGKVDVDAFLKYSLGVQNRRKARMGRALENHLEAVFDRSGVRYTAQVKTETGKRADFIFPGAAEYFDHEFPVSALTMLAAKSSCKERWSQILSESDKIRDKHLVTLEPGISVSGTDMMRQAQVQLVVPGRIRESYTPAQQDWLMSLQDFVGMVSERQQWI